MSDRVRTFIVDSFSNEAFKGNPAGVCLSEQSPDENRMQLIARELNLSETAFVSQERSSGIYAIRYFSPKMEIPLCGHATLAASKVLFENTNETRLRFSTSGRIQLSIQKAGDQIEMEFPVYGLKAATTPKEMSAALGISGFDYCGYNEETKILMLEISDYRELAGLRPDFGALVKSHDSINGVLITAQASDGFDFHSRYFWPWSGTNEDPATGATHTFLAGYWGKKLGKSVMHSFQSSSRTGQMEVELVAEEKLLIRGNAIVVFEGFLRV